MSLTPLSHFSDLRLPESITKALQALNFATPTPIQAQAIPVALQSRDVLASAQTGTGKTAAFCIPMLLRFLQDPQATGLVLAPTRELVHQIEAFWKQLTQFTPNAHAVSLIGGASMQPQVRGLRRNPRLIIATPGRLIDHLERRTVHLDRLAVLVLDEADRMLDMGFAPQLNRILQFVPKRRQTLLFSATFSREAEQLAAKYLHNPHRVQVGSTSQAAPKVTQSFVRTKQALKNAQLFDELVAVEGSVLVFARTQHRTDRLARFLEQGGLQVGRIHGGRTQAQRTSALQAFRDGGLRILVATEIASRGIDVPHVSTVINYDLPIVAEDYIHRIGRTARAGASGQALSFVTPEETAQWRDVLTVLRKSGSANPIERGAAAATPAAKIAELKKSRPAMPPREFANGGNSGNGSPRGHFSGRKQGAGGRWAGGSNRGRPFPKAANQNGGRF